MKDTIKTITIINGKETISYRPLRPTKKQIAKWYGIKKTRDLQKYE